MYAIRAVFLKEVLENLRDRRVVFSAIFFGVLLAPAVFALTTTLASKRIVRDQEQPLKLPVIGESQAPNLMRFLKENGAQIEPIALSADGAVDAVRSGEQDLVLIVPAEYGEKLKSGESAPLDLVVDTANSRTATATERARF